MTETRTDTPRHAFAPPEAALTVVGEVQDPACWLDELVAVDALLKQAVTVLLSLAVPAGAHGVKGHNHRAPFGAVPGMFKDMPDAVGALR